MTGTGGTVVLYTLIRSVIFIEYKKWFLNIGRVRSPFGMEGKRGNGLDQRERRDVEQYAYNCVKRFYIHLHMALRKRCFLLSLMFITTSNQWHLLRPLSLSLSLRTPTVLNIEHFFFI